LYNTERIKSRFVLFRLFRLFRFTFPSFPLQATPQSKNAHFIAYFGILLDKNLALRKNTETSETTETA